MTAMDHVNHPTERAAQLHNMQFGDYDTEADLPPQLWSYGLRLYAEVRRAYDAVDCPLGPTDEAMLVWFTFDPAARESCAEVFEN